VPIDKSLAGGDQGASTLVLWLCDLLSPHQACH
jgi:hypothetical protein